MIKIIFIAWITFISHGAFAFPAYMSAGARGVTPLVACISVDNLDTYLFLYKDKSKNSKEVVKELFDDKNCYRLTSSQFVNFIESRPSKLDNNKVRTIVIKLDSKITNQALFSLQKNK